jgi:hypothetical protein
MQFVASEFAARGIAANGSGRIELIDLEDVYCGAGVCPFGRVGRSYYFDDNHLSISGALLAVAALAPHMAPHRPSTRIP